jgi:hypothetical protein
MSGIRLFCGKNCGLFAAISQTNFLLAPCQQQSASDRRIKSLFINEKSEHRPMLRMPARRGGFSGQFMRFPQLPMNGR